MVIHKLNLQDPEMLSKTVAISGQNSASLVEVEPLFPSLGNELGTHEIGRLGGNHATHIIGLGFFGGDVGDIRPVTLLYESCLS